MNKLETKYENEAMRTSLEWHLSTFDEDMTPQYVYDNLHELVEAQTDTWVWEQVELLSLDELKDSIWNLKASVLATMVSMASYVDNGMKD